MYLLTIFKQIIVVLLKLFRVVYFVQKYTISLFCKAFVIERMC